MSMNPIILCPGQGAQHAGMGRTWAGASLVWMQTMQAADEFLADRLGVRLMDLCLSEHDDRIHRTDIAQPALLAIGVASFRGAFGEMTADQIGAAAGLSLGEYTALHLADAISFHDALDLVAIRGRAMQDAAEATKGGMIAIVGAEEPAVAELCERAAGGDPLTLANYNSPGQIVISGAAAACDRAEKIAAEMGLRWSRLAVAGAFHSALMAPAADTLRAALARVEIREPKCTVMSNATGGPHGADLEPGESVADSIRRRLVDQLTASVRWVQNCHWLIAHHPEAPYHEVAPGKVLTGLMRRIDKNTKVQSHAEPQA